jgi:hypothetical protein
MKGDRYTRVVLTVIAIALVYLCIVFTPLPALNAQRGARPGDDTGPAQVVVVGWRAPERLPVLAQDPIRVTGDVRVSGIVQTEQARNTRTRVVLAGWEERGGELNAGRFQNLDPDAKNPQGVPVTSYAPR